jgi:excisionase family DNA binding protein
MSTRPIRGLRPMTFNRLAGHVGPRMTLRTMLYSLGPPPATTLRLDDLHTMTVEEVAEILGVHVESVRRWVREGELTAARWGGRLRITTEAVRRFQSGRAVHIADPGTMRRATKRPRGSTRVTYS